MVNLEQVRQCLPPGWSFTEGTDFHRAYLLDSASSMFTDSRSGRPIRVDVDITYLLTPGGVREFDALDPRYDPGFTVAPGSTDSLNAMAALICKAFPRSTVLAEDRMGSAANPHVHGATSFVEASCADPDLVAEVLRRVSTMPTFSLMVVPELEPADLEPRAIQLLACWAFDGMGFILAFP